MRPSVFVIDQEATARDAVIGHLRAAGLRARGFSSGRLFLDHLPSDSLACVVTEMPASSAEDVDVARQVLDLHGEAWPVIVLTARADVASAVELMKAGVRDLIEKPFEPQRLVSSVLNCVEGLMQDRPRIEARARNALNLAQLTARERQVFDALAAGRANKEIAAELDISPRTVEIFRAKVMAKMEAANLSALVRMSVDLA
ncbi:response regulator transcription factor [Brevundimonas sp. VNH65]|uniref:response regulator transcription factor n=1 Tax=Brevundimonas sp. VNH65 TaxID=3400917 RepID=UPI003C0660E7